MNDGEAAIEFLRQRGKYATATRPSLIFLDLNLPRKDGREVLAELKRDDDLKRIPVIVLTTSTAERDVRNAYELHANCYVIKPVDLDEFFDAVKECQAFWTEKVRLPAA